MSLRTLGAALSLGLVASGIGFTPVQAVEPAPTDVEVRWEDNTHEHVVLSWSESQPQANRIELRKQGSDQSSWLAVTTAEQPNVLEIRADYLQRGLPGALDAPRELVVRAGTEAGGSEGVSAAFDTDRPLRVNYVSTSRAADGALTVRWRPTFQQDTTPGDPLDRPVRHLVQVSYSAGSAKDVPIGGPTAARQVTYTVRSPHGLSARAQNEWGQSPSNSSLFGIGTTELTAKVPAWVVYGSFGSKVTGTYTAPYNQDRTIVLQARNSSAGPWYAVASGRFRDGKFSFPLGRGGSRQYRVAAPLELFRGGAELVPGSGGAIGLAAATAPVSSTTQLTASGGHEYRYGVPRYDQFSADIELFVNPELTTTATLQRWNGRTWVTVRSVPVRNGRGVTRFGPDRTGRPPYSTQRTAYRFYVPTTVYGGNRFVAAYTPTFFGEVL